MRSARFTRRELLEGASKVAGATLIGTSAQALFSASSQAETTATQVGAILEQTIQRENVTDFQLREYLMKRVPALPKPSSPEEWTEEQKRLRNHVLDEVFFHGWPKEWVHAPPKFEDAGMFESGKGYRMRKLRFEIVPDFWSTAILYEPENVSGKIPATLNLNGHSPEGKAAKYKQKRCINYALRGMYALSPEWLGMGELAHPENSHWFGAHLNLVGACASGLFYLAMRRGLDYLCEHPNVDTGRIGVTGLSGGGWQTIVLGGLDERVAVAIPVAGYFAFISGVERSSDIGDIEYNPPDFRVNFDYTVLTAMRAPRPTLLMYGAEDEYGIRAPLEKPHLYDDIKPFFKLYGKEDAFAWHENIDPGTHNYELDNRQQSYAFFTKHFNMPIAEKEIPVDDEIKSSEQLAIGLPSNNLTILGLAKRFAAEANPKRSPVPQKTSERTNWKRSARTKLNDIVRYKPVTVRHAWPVSSTKNRGLETLSYRFEFNDGLSATGVWLKATTSPDDAPMAVVIDDNGIQKVNTADEANLTNAPILSNGRENSVAWHVNRGEQVLTANLLFTGDASPDHFGTPRGLWCPSSLYTELLSSIGERPLGMEAAQLCGLTTWFRSQKGNKPIFLETVGIRSQTTALVAAALESELFSQILIRNGMASFSNLLEKGVPYHEAPELFCLDLYREFDIDSLVALAEPIKVVQTGAMPD